MDPAPTQYIDRDGAALAYQVMGDGPMNLVIHLEIVQHLDLCWTDPHVHHNFERVANLGRAVVFQRRGFGLSEPVPYVPTLEQQAEDVLAVMDAAGMDHAILFGTFSACAAVAMAAACAPERVSTLLLHVPFVDGLPYDDYLPPGWSEAEAAGYREVYDAAYGQWGSGLVTKMWSQVTDTPYNRRLMGLLERSSATPAAAVAHGDWFRRMDITDVVGAIQVPTHVIRQDSDLIPAAAVQRAVELIPGAVYESLPGVAAGSSLGEAYAAVVDHVEQSVLGPDHRPSDTDRALGTVLFTDIVGSTELLVRLGDADYRRVRDAHERAVHLAVETAGGRLVKVLGDGTLSVFDGPGRAVRCADVIRREAAALGLEVRAGLHTGEIERAGPDIAGLTVHIGARVSALAGPGEILVSRTVRDIVVGSGLEFTDGGEHELKGVPGRWQVFGLVTVDSRAGAVEVEPSMQTVADRAMVAAARRSPATMRTLMRVGDSIQRMRHRRARMESATA